MYKVAIVTPYYDDPVKWLERCHESVLAQSYPTTHILVADGKPNREVERWHARHIRLPHRHCDFGDTPRTVGAVDAIGSGYDAIGFLDADNWLAEDHVASCLAAAQEARAGFVSSGRYLCHLNGRVMGVCDNCNGETFVDTSSMLFLGDGLPLVYEWNKIPWNYHPICDRVMFSKVKSSGVQRAHVARPTVYYRVSQPSIYELLDEPVPETAQFDWSSTQKAIELWDREQGQSVRFKLRATKIAAQPELHRTVTERARIASKP
jgi:glycosyltransferase involved in cell wall biosynthesis